MVNALRKKQPGWPVALVKPIKNPKKAKSSVKSPAKTSGKTSAKKEAGAAKKKKSGTLEKKKSKSKSLKKKKPIWLHGSISKEEADELMTKAGLDDGRYLVRSREGKKTEFVLGVVYKGRPTHHLITKVDGNYLINKKSYGTHAKVSALIATLQKKGTPKWPVPLDRAVPSERYLKEQAEAEAEETPAADTPAPAADTPAPAADAPAPAADAPAAAVDDAVAAPVDTPAAAADEPATAGPGLNQDTTRVITRATINIGAKINQYEPHLAMVANQLTLLEQFVLDIQKSSPNRMSFAQMNTAMLDGGHHANTTA